MQTLTLAPVAVVPAATDDAAGPKPTSASDTPSMALSKPWEAACEGYCVYVVFPADYAHAQALHDVAGAVSAAFAAFGGRAPLVTHPAGWQGRTPIVFGSHLLADRPVAELPPDAVLFNLEPLDAGSFWMRADYLARLKRHPLLDCSWRNIRALAAAGLDHAVIWRSGRCLCPSRSHDGRTLCPTSTFSSTAR